MNNERIPSLLAIAFLLVLHCHLRFSKTGCSPILSEGIRKSAIFPSAALGIDPIWRQVFLIATRWDQPHKFPMNLGPGLLCEVISHYLIDLPSIQFGRKIIARRVRLPFLRIVTITSGVEPS